MRGNEEGVVHPACTGDFFEVDVVLGQEFLAIERRPNGRMVQQKLSHLVNRTGLMLGFDAALISAGNPVFGGAGAVLYLCLYSRSTVFLIAKHAPICRTCNIYLVFSAVCLDKINKFLNHSWLKIIVRLNNTHPCAMSCGNTTITRCSVAFVFFVYDDKASITGSICFQKS